MVFNAKKYIESILHDYPYCDQYINDRVKNMVQEAAEESLRNSNKDLTEKQIKEALYDGYKDPTIKDPKIWALKRDNNLAGLQDNQDVINACLAELNEHDLKIIAAVFFSDYRTATEAAEHLHVSGAKVSRVANKFIKAVAKRKGFEL
ncbi:hypothetical protein FC56_GL000233 [Lentilactobacillus senioris DSM 24302 = JCM 17472]|uniref:Uncharacterized protein n=1 Tax=Lentilactobacillus senioris DSM 24302 = JCM 17472 TaxID=1423802 RepID=A0A0R2CP53_9LACO|nr:hypothetical protein [Lentilactobacillus senioris]KRM93521.1 hypothetical protein FC56_GL000233 [Lentilactobacillus senioris DSM 24302 = JCM 17472]